MSRFDYVKYDDTAQAKQSAVKAAFEELEKVVSGYTPPGRAQSLILTKLEEAYMWVGKAIRDEQVEKRSAELQEGRSNG